MSAVNDNNFIAIQGWMRTKLNLKGNELIVYALIYGFSQDGNSSFSGSRRYIAEWCGCSMRTVDNTLASLLGKRLIVKHEKDVNGVRLCDYTVVPPEIAARRNDTQAPAAMQDPRDDTANADAERSPRPAVEPEPTPQAKKTRKGKSFDDIIDGYTDDPQTKDLLGAWLQNRKAKRAAMTDRAIQGCIDKLDKCARQSRMTVNDYLDEVVCRGWSAFFPIENYQRNGYQQQPQRQQRQWPRTTEEERRHAEEERQRAEDFDYYLKNCVF